MNKLEEAFGARNKKQNKVEETKALKSPQDSFAQLEYYAQQGYDAIPEEDKGYFLKCFGIFDRPATPKKFMIRVRVPGGHLNYDQATAIGEVARDYGKDYIDITTRAQVELRYLEIENIPTVLKKLESVGISTFQTGVDNFRNIVNDPLDALGFDNILPSQPLLLRLQEKFLHNWEWISVLPRKFNTAISGSTTNRCNVYGHDCCFVLAQKDGCYGYNLYLGGKVGEVAKNADIFLKDDTEVMALYEALITLFKTYGFRDNRNKNRLHFLIEHVGMLEFSHALRKQAGIDFLTAGDTLTQMENIDADHGKVQLRDKSYAVHVVVPSGVFTGTALIQSADAAKTYGNSQLRFDIEQNIYLLGIKEDHLPLLYKHRLFDDYKSVNTPYYNHLLACAGTEHCPFGVINNKSDAIEMAEHLSQTVPLAEGSKIKMYWSACVKGCGIHSLGDIGFEGCKAKVDGNTEDGVHILVGGKTSGQSSEGYSVLKSVPLRYAKFYVQSLAIEYKRLKHTNESFERFHDRVLRHYSHASIGFMMMLLDYLRRKDITIDFGFQNEPMSGKNEAFEIFEFGRILYTQLLKIKPYERIENFNPITNTPLEKLQKSDSALDDNLANLVYEMVRLENRAVVFSEINHYVSR